MHTTYSITTFEQLCEQISHIDDADSDFSGLLSKLDPKVLSCNIRIVGDGYGPRIPGNLLQALADFQISTMRTYAFLMKGKEDLRGLPKEALWSDIEIEEGSLKLRISPQNFFFDIPTTMFNNLSPNQKILLILLPAILLTGYGVYSKHTQAAKEIEITKINSQASIEIEKNRPDNQVKIELLKESAITERERKREETIQKAFETISKISNNNESFKQVLDVAETNARSGVEGIIQNAHGAKQVDVGEKTFSHDEILKIQTPESLPTNRYPKDGEFLIVQINTEKQGSWKVQLKDTGTSEKISASFDPETLFLSIDRAKEIFDYQRDEKIIYVKLSVLEKGTNISYGIDELKPL